MEYTNGMVLLASKIGSKVVTVLCPKCGRISRQIARDEYNSQPSLFLHSNHTCPICASVYSIFSEIDRTAWSTYYSRYERQGEQSYNSDIKNTFQEKLPCTLQNTKPFEHQLTDTSFEEKSHSGTVADNTVDSGISITTANTEVEPITRHQQLQSLVIILKQHLDLLGKKVQTIPEPEQTDGTDIPSSTTMGESVIIPQPISLDVNSASFESLSKESSSGTVEFISIPKVTPLEKRVHPNIAAFDRKFDHWKKQLLDLSKRNKMINYRETKRTTLRILEPDFIDLFNRLAINEEELTFQRPIDKDSDIRTFSVLTLLETLAYPIPVHIGDIKAEGSLLERKITLSNLRSKSKLAKEEQGTNILYLSFGFIEWKENNSQSAGWLKSPVLMMPVSLKLESLSAPFTLSRYDDEIEVNPTLDYLFNDRYGVDLPTFELKDESSIGQYMQIIEEIADKNGWKLTREISLGLLSFLKISMYHDINKSYDRMIQNPVVRAITGNSESVNNIPKELDSLDYDRISPNDCYQVVNADSSQQEAVMLSKAGVSFVMQGPPGTGKSQTITNIIAEALADGKKVLFVSEKSAALEVVYKRLTEAGLSDFCLALHSHKANKKEVLDSIAANLKLSRSRVKDSVMVELSELFHDKQFLNQYVQELHTEILPLEKSLYEAFGELTALKVIPSLQFELESPASISSADYHKMLYNVSNYAKALRCLGMRLSDNPWSGTTIKQLDESLRDNLLKNTEGVTDKLKNLNNSLITFQEVFGLPRLSSWVYANKMVSLLNLLENLPLFQAEWKDDDIRNKALLIAQERNDLSTRYYSGKSIIMKTFDKSIFEMDMDSLIISMRTALDVIHNTNKYSALSDDEILVATPTTAEKLENAISEIESVIEAYEKLEDITGIYAPCTDKSVRTLSAIGVMLASSPIVQRDWCDKEGLEKAQKLLSDAETRSTRLIATCSEVLENYANSVLSIDTVKYLDRFTNFYTDSVKNLIIQYENDFGALKGLSKDNITLEHDAIIRLFETLIELKSLHADLSKNDSEFSERFTNEYKGIDTFWKKIDKLFEQIGEQIEMAKVVSKEIVSSREIILAKWESGVFDIDAGAMLLRFRTEYSSFIKIIKPSYRRDILLLKGLYKVFGEKMTDAIVVALLQDLKAIAEKEQSFSQDANLIAKHFSREYNGHRTDWTLLKTFFEQMSAQKEKVTEITDEIKSIRKAVLDGWTDGVFTISEAEIEQMLTRFSCDYTPSFCETMRQYKNDVSMFVGMKAKDKNSTNGTEIIRLLHNINTINDETSWFENETQSLLAKTFADDFTGYNTKWSFIADKMEFTASLINELGCNTISEIIKNIISDKSAHDRKCAEIAVMLEKITNEKLDNALAETRTYLTVVNETDFKNVLLAMLYDLKNNFDTLVNSVEQLQNRASVEIPYESALNYAQDIQANSMLKSELISLSDTDSILFKNRYEGIETNWCAIITDIVVIAAFFEAPEAELLSERFIHFVCNDVLKRLELSKIKEALTARIYELRNGYSVFSSLFNEEANIQNLPLSALSDKIVACMDNFILLENWLTCLETKATCDVLGLSDFTHKIENSDNTIENVVGVFKRGFYTAWIQSVIGNKKAVEQFRRHIHDNKIGHFVTLDNKQLHVARERIRQNIIENIPDANRLLNANDELSVLQREISKKRRVMPLRKLFKSIPNLLLKLKPCLMMSPLSVAYFLEAESYEFDTVIFDEASQIFPEDAIGAICRGTQVIIAGDSKQLPPSAYFKKVTSNNENGFGDDDEQEEFEIYDSILEETTGVLPNMRLLWHYRSKHENLIAFSNQSIYNNDLITFPSSREAAHDSGVEFVFVEDGIYEGKGRNTGEARRCVELVKTHIERYPTRSLGIIAFSESQQKAIVSEIQKFREQNLEYEDFFAEGREDEFFVKNLENVQGDERDTIIFSVSYAKTKEQRDKNQSMALRFGPLGQKGGERRLNVAITRAKHNVKLVSSIVPSDIDLSRTESEGVKMLRSYIEFAMRGSGALQAAHSADENDVFMGIVSEFLLSQGYKIKKYVGCSGYKIDIAILHPEIESCFVAGIECDGYSYRSAKTARDRDHLRKSILNSMGWNIYRVWSSEWITRPEIEKQKLIAFINAAVTEYSAESNLVENKPANQCENTVALTETVYEETSDDSQEPTIAYGNGNPFGFDDYIEAVWTDAPVNDFGKIEEMEAIKYIVGVEQPMNIDLLYQRMARAYGQQKATAKIRDYVDRVISHPRFKGVVIKDDDGFVTLTGFADLKVRVPAPSSVARQVNFISPDEIGLAMTTIASQAIGISSDDLIEATARAFGYARKGERVMGCMNKALERLVSAGRVKMIDGKVNVVGGGYHG